MLKSRNSSGSNETRRTAGGQGACVAESSDSSTLPITQPLSRAFSPPTTAAPSPGHARRVIGNPRRHRLSQGLLGVLLLAFVVGILLFLSDLLWGGGGLGFLPFAPLATDGKDAEESARRQTSARLAGRAVDAGIVSRLYQEIRQAQRTTHGKADLSGAERTANGPQCTAEYELNHSGFKNAPPDSSVLMLFDGKGPSQYQYVGGGNRAADTAPGGDSCVPLYDAAYVSESFGRVAASFLSSPYAAASADDVIAPYFDFFASHEATLWETGVRKNAEGALQRVAWPLQMDVVYTYVNPTAPSFKAHMKYRNATAYDEGRYNDWEELRFSLRSLAAHALRSDGLVQHPAQVRADAKVLRGLGYEVDLRVRRTPWERASGDADAYAGAEVSEGDAPFPLLRTVYLMLSAEDQVPAWLDVAAFPQLRVVTHRDMYSDATHPDVLPTLNSNAIEAGLHRIPGLSRYYLYSNNDQFLGRKASFFDLFRPLSPARQRLKVAHSEIAVASTVDSGESSRGRGCGGTRCGGPPCEREFPQRRFVFMEPIVHNHIRTYKYKFLYKEDPQRKEKGAHRQKQAACLRRAALSHLSSMFSDSRESKQSSTAAPVGTTKGEQESTQLTSKLSATIIPDALLPFLSLPAWRTTLTCSLPDPYDPLVTGWFNTPVYYYAHATNTLNGMRMPFGYPHMAVLHDKAVETALTEEIYAEETRKTRLAYERRRYPFSVIDLYGVVWTALTRARTRAEWREVMTATSPQRQHHPLAVEWAAMASARVVAAVAAGRLHLPAVSTAMIDGAAMDALGPLYGDTWDVRLQAPELAEELGLWWLPGARPPPGGRREVGTLLNLYAVPQLRRIRRAAGVASDKQSNRNATKWNVESTAMYERLAESYTALYHDLFSHGSKDATYRFHMMVSTRKVHDVAAQLREQRGRRPLFIGLNDDFRTERQSKALVEQEKAAFKVLMAVATDDAPAGRWENDM